MVLAVAISLELWRCQWEPNATMPLRLDPDSVKAKSLTTCLLRMASFPTAVKHAVTRLVALLVLTPSSLPQKLLKAAGGRRSASNSESEGCGALTEGLMEILHVKLSQASAVSEAAQLVVFTCLAFGRTGDKRLHLDQQQSCIQAMQK